MKQIIKSGLNNGEFKQVERKTLTPIVSQLGQDIPIENLSSGNLYLIQRMLSLLGKFYAVYLNNLDLELNELLNLPGILLIDEAENQLHPEWQKKLFSIITSMFTNLQIIATTHSPFIVASAENAKVFVCKGMGDHSIVEDVTAEYSNMPIEEVLLSDAFNSINFNEEISDLIKQRKNAVKENDQEKIDEVENKLKEKNPEYFSYLDIDELLTQVSKK